MVLGGASHPSVQTIIMPRYVPQSSGMCTGPGDGPGLLRGCASLSLGLGSGYQSCPLGLGQDLGARHASMALHVQRFVPVAWCGSCKFLGTQPLSNCMAHPCPVLYILTFTSILHTLHICTPVQTCPCVPCTLATSLHTLTLCLCTSSPLLHPVTLWPSCKHGESSPSGCWSSPGHPLGCQRLVCHARV